MHRTLLTATKIAAASAGLAAAIAVAAPATASAAPLTGTHANLTSYAAYFFGSGANFEEATVDAEDQAAQDGYWACTVVSESTFPGIFGPTYSVTVGCNVF